MKETIIQFGEGNFLRGFADYFIHKLNEKGLYDGKAVVIQPIEQGLAELINAQGGEYNLFLRGIENGAGVQEHTKVTSISRAIDPYRDFDSFLALAQNPDFRFIISNTTEAGIAYDAACMPTDCPPASFPGKLTLLLFERFREGLNGFVVLSCELIDRNGGKLLDCVLQYADQWQLGEGFTDWLKTENHFCNTLVDRIVTGYPEAEAAALCNALGYEDPLLDTAEIYHLWVIEGNFEKELPLQEAGFHVVWTDDAAPYKKRKVRVLNGAHTSMVSAALLAGRQTVAECVGDGLLGAFIHKCVFDEILPTIGQTGDNLQFANDVLERFQNPYIHHKLMSIALNSVSKFSVRVLPSIFDFYEQTGVFPKALTFSLAALLVFYKTGNPKDSEEVIAYIKEHELAEILSSTALWGRDLTPLIPAVQAGIEKIQNDGIVEAIQWIL